MTIEDKHKLLAQLDALKIFPNNKLVRELKNKIKIKLDRLEKIENNKLITRNVDLKIKADLSRSSKLQKYHHYLRLIRDNFPELDYSTIRSQFSKRKQGTEVSIPDAIWQNPSP